ncbi:MAG: hypothetical protein ACOCRX_06590 [Candidatus Woesearchaeota archaeon]
MEVSRLIGGIGLIIFSLIMLIPLRFTASHIIPNIVGIIAFILGIFLLFNKDENKIEQIKK